ncbi:MAG: agmatinase [Deltaproteobacteria bacterium]|nr:agmatinase [Deltaproteobacteria bacterium]
MPYIEANSPPGAGKIRIVGAPFDSTATFRPGSRFGPQAIRDASKGLETYSAIQDVDLKDIEFMDIGDMELPFGDPKPALDIIEDSIEKIISEEKIPFMLGGEHLVTLGAIRAVTNRYPELKVIDLDAHADLRDRYIDQELSHSTVIRRITDIIGIDSIRQIGIRSGTREECAISKELTSSPEDITLWALDAPCYITCDLDILDPSVFSGTGTPEPGGYSFNELIEILIKLISTLNVIGIDVVELAPLLDPSGISSVVAAKIVRECIIALGIKDSR